MSSANAPGTTLAAAAVAAMLLGTHLIPRLRAQVHLVVHLPWTPMMMFRLRLLQTPIRLMIPTWNLPPATASAATTGALVTPHQRRASWLALLVRAMRTVTPPSP